MQIEKIDKKKLSIQSGNINKYLSSNPFMKFIVRKFLKDLRSIINNKNFKKVLDVGCGEGFVSASLKEHNKELDLQGLDISHNSLNLAKELFSLDVVRASIYHTPFVRETFDLVICCEVLEHLTEPETAIKAIKGLSSRTVIFSVPREPIFRICNILRLRNLSRWGNSIGHIQNWTKKEFSEYLSKYFDNVHIKTSTVWTIAVCE